MFHRLTFVALSCTFSAAATAATVPLQREFDDWVVTCDNLRHCVAEGADSDTPSLVLRLTRAPGAAGAATLRIDGLDAGSALMALRVDDQPLALDARRWSADDDDGLRAWTTSDDAAIARFIIATGDGTRLRLGDSTGSLDGFAAALLLIDDVQGRVGTTTAWRKPGAQPAASVPAATAPPLRRATPFLGPPISPAQSRALLAAAYALATDARSDCDLAEDDEPQTEVARLNATDALVLRECGRGAYQSGFRAYRGPIDAPAQLRQIALPSAPGRPEVTWLMDAGYDDASATLSHFSKGRGLADCGETARWLFDGRGFVLESLAIEPRCQGVMLEFPALWRNE